MTRAFSALALFAAATLLAACGGDSATAPIPISGSYVLSTVNGTPVPFKITVQDTTITVTADTVLIGADGSWTEDEHSFIALTDPTNPLLTIYEPSALFVSAGTYTHSGTSYHFSYSWGASASDSVSIVNGVLTIPQNWCWAWTTPVCVPPSGSSTSFTAVYHRQQ